MNTGKWLEAISHITKMAIKCRLTYLPCSLSQTSNFRLMALHATVPWACWVSCLHFIFLTGKFSTTHLNDDARGAFACAFISGEFGDCPTSASVGEQIA